MAYSNKTKIAGFSWYLNRFKKMPIREMAYRLNQFMKKKNDKHFPSNLVSKSFNVKLHSAFLEHFKNNKEGFSYLEISGYEIKQILEEADSIVQHNFNIFNIKANFGSPINFHLDPKTGKTWPIIFWGDIDYRNSDAIGGIKFAWELNRLHHWPKLAIAYSISEDQKYFDELFKQMEHWMDTNPYPKGINWISGIEIGIRIVNLVYMLRCLSTENLKYHHKELIYNFVHVHAKHLYRYPSKYSSCANHAIAEALGLFFAGLCFPSLEDAHNWKSFGKKVLEREITRQIYSDGSSFEHTIPYLQFVADHFLVYYLICEEFHETINTEIEKRLKLICTFVSYIIDIKGNVPMIGDDDDGYLLKLWFGEHNNFLSLLNTASILFNRPEWIHPSATLDLKTMLLLGNSVRSKWEKLKKEEAWKIKSHYFDNAGLGVISHLKEEKEIKFIGNSGPLGLKPMSGHGHADALSFFLAVNGQPFFIDPGTYLYHSGGTWRRYFKSTAAHNTIQVDGQDQSEQVADFMFGGFYNVKNIHWSEKEDLIYWEAEHDGYQRLSDSVIHRRKVCYKKREYSFMITDIIKCSGNHDIRLLFQLHPDVSVSFEGDNNFKICGRNVSVVLRVDHNLKGEILTGSKNPLFGWYSQSFNQLKKTNSLVFTKKIYGDSVLKSEVTIL